MLACAQTTDAIVYVGKYTASSSVYAVITQCFVQGGAGIAEDGGDVFSISFNR